MSEMKFMKNSINEKIREIKELEIKCSQADDRIVKEK